MLRRTSERDPLLTTAVPCKRLPSPQESTHLAHLRPTSGTADA
jgi:hypothetical protein